ncbi:unnamed protein product [Miscanthus lutarioriparius]|uniref:Uncharacterized protein n=1 Tax=Miscanthus lutarioriparius TaxID=422564 RepID=A0A811QQ04_9POAL|nr:unnamed protein product [Miscanthus lutarioriparius]
MARKRKSIFLDIASSDGSEGLDDNELMLSPNSLPTDGNDDSDSHDIFYSDDSISGGDQSFNEALYKQYVKECSKVKMLKKRLLIHLSRDVKKKSDGRPKVGVLRFFVSTFSNVINSLSEERKDVIRKYGFGSLLLFDRCSVLRIFVHWVARLVNYKSGDIVVDGKVISLRKLFIWFLIFHLVVHRFLLIIPLGSLVCFQALARIMFLQSVIFSEALVYKKEMSDDDMFVCFIVVAMSTFLCPNSSVVPCKKFFGIFEDLDKIRSYDWCGYILSLLLEYIKLFNQLKSCKSTQQVTLSGCLYFLAVLYLDHVDFDSHQVPSTIPRISVWKNDMIKQYATLDKKQEGCFGYHPIIGLFKDLLC